MGNVKIGVNLGTPDAASAQMETGQAWSFRTGGGGGVLYAGHGAPSLSIGGIGDFYLDLDTGDLYGPKAEGDWGSPLSLGGGPGAITTAQSVTGDGSGGDPVQLVNDETPAAGSRYFYGQSAAGAKGWQPFITSGGGGGGDTGAGYWSPLTNGDWDSPELIFASGDTIAVWTAT